MAMTSALPAERRRSLPCGNSIAELSRADANFWAELPAQSINAALAHF
jgi:hypothetical protein